MKYILIQFAIIVLVGCSNKKSCSISENIKTSKDRIEHKTIKKVDNEKQVIMPSLKLFPKIEDVFLDKYELNRNHFMPIVTIDLKSIDKKIDGHIHLVYFNNDPYCKDATTNEFCDEYKSSFDIVDNKYVFKSDYSFFNTNDNWIEWLDKGKESYNENIKKFNDDNSIYRINEVIGNVGKEPFWVQEDQWPMDEQGKKLIFICQIWSHNFVKDYCEEHIYLFYDKTNNIAVQIHQIT